MGTLLGFIMAKRSRKKNKIKKKNSKDLCIPEDLWVEILRRLPVKYLYQVRCVCRRWNSLVSSPSFLNLYLNNNNSPAAPAIILGVQRVGTVLSDLRPYGVQYGGRRLTRRVRSKTPRVGFMDVIHGVVCIAYSWGSSLCAATLWNPSIHTYVSVPWPPSIVEGLGQITYVMGFGFDSRTNDFKAVALFDDDGWYAAETDPYFQVFSVQGGAWGKSIEYCGEPNWNIMTGWPGGLFANGAIHWVAMPAKHHHYPYNALYLRLVLFGCERNESRTMELPLQVDRMCAIPTLKVLTYGFSVLGYNQDAHVVDVWAMEEYGVATSWRKMLSLHPHWVGPHRSSVSFAFQPNLLLMDVHGARDSKLGKEFLLEDDEASVFWMNIN